MEELPLPPSKNTLLRTYAEAFHNGGDLKIGTAEAEVVGCLRNANAHGGERDFRNQIQKVLSSAQAHRAERS